MDVSQVGETTLCGVVCKMRDIELESIGGGISPRPPIHLIPGNSLPEACRQLGERAAVAADLLANQGKLRVLIIEDDALIAEVLAEVLIDMGFSVCGIEATEADAVENSARSQPDLMIVDANLREGNGICAVQTIIGGHFIPHIFVSGDRLLNHAIHPRAIFLQKPFLEADLAQAIQRALGTDAG